MKSDLRNLVTAEENYVADHSKYTTDLGPDYHYSAGNRPPTITLTDTSAMGGMAMSDKVNAMAMQGIGEGVADLHYGDNVKLTAGHVYEVVVTVKGEKATFSFKA